MLSLKIGRVTILWRRAMLSLKLSIIVFQIKGGGLSLNPEQLAGLQGVLFCKIMLKTTKKLVVNYQKAEEELKECHY